jgi:hypothetical protein
MSASVNNQKRNVIPRWRDFEQTLSLGELSSIEQKSNVKFNFINSPDHQQKIIDWKSNKTVSNAIELLNSSFVVDDNDNSSEVAQFLSQRNIVTSSPIKSLSSKLLNDTTLISIDEQAPDFENFDSIIKVKIQNARRSISYNQNNPISWIELARLYLIIGKEYAAERCILVAIHLSSDNRYVSRISSRFFTHIGDFKKAKQILKLNKSFNVDPWLISADIGISSLQNKSSFNIKKGVELINSKNYSPFQLNELLSALATVELYSGSINNSRKLFNQSLIKPNDNTLAQAVWAKKLINNLNLTQSTFEKVPNVYEAKTYFYFYSNLWNQSFSNVLQWFIDQPFSRDPAGFGSFIASSVLGKYDEGIKLCIYGLKATPNDFILMNNLAYCYLKKDEITHAQVVINKIHYEGLTEREKVIYNATKGLLMYKFGKNEAGDILYKLSSQLADKIKDKNLKLLADFNHLAIQLEMENIPSDKILKLDRMEKELKETDEYFLKQLMKNLRNKLNNKNNRHYS